MEIETCNKECCSNNTVNDVDTSKTASTINIKIDAELKKEAEEIFKHFGINFNTAINMFLKKVVNVGGIPFELKYEVPNKKTLKAMKRVQEYVESGGKKHKRYFTECDSIEDLKKKLGIKD